MKERAIKVPLEKVQTTSTFDLTRIKALLETRAENGGAEKMNILNFNPNARIILVQFTYKHNYSEFAVYDYTEEGFLDLSVESALLSYALDKYNEREKTETI